VLEVNTKRLRPSQALERYLLTAGRERKEKMVNRNIWIFFRIFALIFVVTTPLLFSCGGGGGGGGETTPTTPPTVTSVIPSSGTQGQILDVTIAGTNFTGATSVSFGEGITVSMGSGLFT